MEIDDLGIDAINCYCLNADRPSVSVIPSTAIVLMQIDRLYSDAVHCYCLNANRPSV